MRGVVALEKLTEHYQPALGIPARPNVPGGTVADFVGRALEKHGLMLDLMSGGNKKIGDVPNPF